MHEYKGIDIGRVIFACLIPALHIALPEGAIIYVIRQYLSRLGVPFFYAVSGAFLSISKDKYGEICALQRYLKRVGRILLVWLVIYSPILIVWSDSYISLIQRIVFNTPCYLWYLTGLLVAAIPFCIVKDRRKLFIFAGVLYIVGTLFGDSYKWIMGGVPTYESIFLTTRNGIFFGLPIMCVGELTWKKNINGSIIGLALSGILLCLEITIVGINADEFTDRSMYFLLPFFIYYLIPMFRKWNPQINGKHLAGISSAIYLMQFGIITAVELLFMLFNINNCGIQGWSTWLLVIITSTGFYLLFRNTKIVYWLF